MISIEKATKFVRDSIGEPIAVVEARDGGWIAVAYRSDHWGGSELAYSTHAVYDRGCESGHYDMSMQDACVDLVKRACYYK